MRVSGKSCSLGLGQLILLLDGQASLSLGLEVFGGLVAQDDVLLQEGDVLLVVGRLPQASLPAHLLLEEPAVDHPEVVLGLLDHCHVPVAQAEVFHLQVRHREESQSIEEGEHPVVPVPEGLAHPSLPLPVRGLVLQAEGPRAPGAESARIGSEFTLKFALK